MSDSSGTLTSILSEGTGANHGHHHYVPNGRQHSNPQPDGVAGHFAVILRFRGAGVAGVEVGGRRLQGRVAIVGRIHEGAAHSREMLPGKRAREEKTTTNGSFCRGWRRLKAVHGTVKVGILEVLRLGSGTEKGMRINHLH